MTIKEPAGVNELVNTQREQLGLSERRLPLAVTRHIVHATINNRNESRIAFQN